MALNTWWRQMGGRRREGEETGGGNYREAEQRVQRGQYRESSCQVESLLLIQASSVRQ
jgi:hypothetical protein